MITPNPKEIEALLSSYRGGRIPPFHELIRRQILDSFFRGFTESHGFSIAVLYPNGDPTKEDSWQRWGDVPKPGHNAPFCLKCAELKDAAGNCPPHENCYKSDLILAVEAAKAKRTVLRICLNGLLEIATPVVFEGIVVAVLITGQLRPRAGAIWDTADIGGIENRGPNTDLWSICEGRIRMLQANIVNAPDLLTLADQHEKVSPEDVDAYRQDLEVVRDILLELASLRVEVDRHRLADFFRGRLFEFSIGRDDFWRFLREDWLNQWHPTADAMILALAYKEDSDRVRVPFGLGIANLKTGTYQIENKNQWAEILKGAGSKSMSRPMQLRNLLKACTLPREKMTLLPLGRRGFLVYGVRGDMNGPHFPEANTKMFETFGNDIGLILEDIEANQAREDFLAYYSHELRSPITTASKIIERIQGGRFAGQQEVLSEKCRNLQTLLDRLKRLVDGLWHIQKILAERVTYTLKPQFLGEKIVFYASQAKEVSDRLDVGIAVDRDSLSRLRVPVDEKAFELVVFNLLDNALKYSSAGTEIRITGRREEQTVVLTFTNIGIRVPPLEELDVFARFARTKEAECLAPQSAGLGLFLVRHIIEKGHGGTVSGTSVPHGPRDHFVKFEVRLPL